MIPFIDLAAQQQLVKNEIDARIERVLSHGKYILGPEVAELEERLADYTGAKYCITCANGTDALQISMMALDVGPGDEVITPGFSYVSAAEAASVLGASPVYVDVDSITFNIDPTLIEAAITSRTKAIVPVSLFGQCANLNAINSVARKHGLPVIEDGAQSFGSVHNGQKSCNLSTIGCTSFHPTKPLGCYGDGGAVFTNDEELAWKIRQIARHGQERRYYYERLGMNSRLDTLQAAILLAKLTIFPKEIEMRRKAAGYYIELLKNLNIQTPIIESNNESVWAQFTTRLQNRDSIKSELSKLGVPTVVYYPLPLNRQPAVPQDHQRLPVGDRLSQEVLSLPMHPYLKRHDQERIADSLQTVIEKQK